MELLSAQPRCHLRLGNSSHVRRHVVHPPCLNRWHCNSSFSRLREQQLNGAVWRCRAQQGGGLPPVQPPISPPPSPPPAALGGTGLVLVSCAFYICMTLAGVALGERTGPVPVADQLFASNLDLLAALGWLVPFLLILWATVQYADRLPGFARLKEEYEEKLIPALSTVPIWGLGLLALGAGVGEETLFRAFLQSSMVSSLGAALTGWSPGWITGLGVALTSVLFGALHALTPTYFVVATLAGAAFGVEYLTAGLPAAACTHFLYDWVALVYILQQWGGRPGGMKTSSSGSPTADT